MGGGEPPQVIRTRTFCQSLSFHPARRLAGYWPCFSATYESRLPAEAIRTIKGRSFFSFVLTVLAASDFINALK